MTKKNENNNLEKIFRNGLIILTCISLIITILNFTYVTYQDVNNIDTINNLLVNYVNKLLWIDNILLYIFAIGYIVLGVKSKKEVLLKVSFSIFSIITAMLSLTMLINILASIFGMI